MVLVVFQQSSYRKAEVAGSNPAFLLTQKTWENAADFPSGVCLRIFLWKIRKAGESPVGGFHRTIVLRTMVLMFFPEAFFKRLVPNPRRRLSYNQFSHNQLSWMLHMNVRKTIFTTLRIFLWGYVAYWAFEFFKAFKGARAVYGPCGIQCIIKLSVFLLIILSLAVLIDWALKNAITSLKEHKHHK